MKVVAFQSRHCHFSVRSYMSVLYELGEFRLNPEVRVLTHKGVAVALGARAVAVLTALVSRANEYVQKAAIMDAAWPGLVVEENNLAAQISAIRRALARVPGGDEWIETLARRGYRFVGPVVEITGRPGPAIANRARTNLPGRLTSFIGREREMAEFKRLLPTTRLLTLTGTGGIGKTRLAQQVAAEVLDAYRDGVWFIDLAPVFDPELGAKCAGAGVAGKRVGWSTLDQGAVRLPSFQRDHVASRQLRARAEGVRAVGRGGAARGCTHDIDRHQPRAAAPPS